MRAACILVALIAISSAASAAPTPSIARGTFAYGDAIGKWKDSNGKTILTFHKDGSVEDTGHPGVLARTTKPKGEANLIVTYGARLQEIIGPAAHRSCSYTALLDGERKKLLLVERGPTPIGWACYHGLLLRSE